MLCDDGQARGVLKHIFTAEQRNRLLEPIAIFEYEPNEPVV